AKAGETVTLTPAPDAGYEVVDVTVTDRFGDAVEVTEQADGTYTFTMPNGQVSVNVTFVEVQTEPLPFTDVSETDWFHDAVQYVYDNGLMGGVGDGQFAPNATTNRAMVVTILYRLAGEPAVSGDAAFTDVADGLWYTDAVLWAAQKGIVNGISATEFAPAGDLTREQLATILFRYAESAGYDVSASADLSGFPDADQIQSYAAQALSWAVAEGLLQGFEDDTLRPQGNATRAQIATILMRFCQTVAE
ncbi:S-layer homology domain-containing protein, partial [Evtepia sp.]